MFYSAQILSKKGPLGTCWLASWSQRGLKRNEVFATSLPAAAGERRVSGVLEASGAPSGDGHRSYKHCSPPTCALPDSIINPEAPLALRLSGQLLLGLVRLYLRKLQFLEEDAGQALRGLARVRCWGLLRCRWASKQTVVVGCGVGRDAAAACTVCACPCALRVAQMPEMQMQRHSAGRSCPANRRPLPALPAHARFCRMRPPARAPRWTCLMVGWPQRWPSRCRWAGQEAGVGLGMPGNGSLLSMLYYASCLARLVCMPARPSPHCLQQARLPACCRSSALHCSCFPVALRLPPPPSAFQDTGYDPMAAFVGNELFPSFESSMFGEGSEGGGLGLGGGGASLTVAQDISELFGSRWTAPEGEEGDAAMERRFRWEGGTAGEAARARAGRERCAASALLVCSTPDPHCPSSMAACSTHPACPTLPAPLLLAQHRAGAAALSGGGSPA